MKYQIRIYDNFEAFKDDDGFENGGEYSSYNQAVEKAKSIVKKSLIEQWKRGYTVEDLYDAYTSFGAAPYIVPSEEGCIPFSPITFASTIVDAVFEKIQIKHKLKNSTSVKELTTVSKINSSSDKLSTKGNEAAQLNSDTVDKTESKQPPSKKMTIEELLKNTGGKIVQKKGAFLMPLSKEQREALQKKEQTQNPEIKQDFIKNPKRSKEDIERMEREGKEAVRKFLKNLNNQ
jgi:hypothetical protein